MSLSTMKTVTLVFGLFYFAIGVLGFIPGITVSTTVPGQGLLLGILTVNAIHNILHLVAGKLTSQQLMPDPRDFLIPCA